MKEGTIDWKSVPKSATRVMRVLLAKREEHQRGKTEGSEVFRIKPQELSDLCGQPPRTVRYALKKLLDMGFVERVPDLTDLRTFYYFIPESN